MTKGRANELRETSPDLVLLWFREAWPSRDKYPDKSICYSVATHVNIVVRVENAQLLRTPSQREVADTKERYDTALKYGRLFIQHVSKVRESLVDRATIGGTNPSEGGLSSPWLEERSALLKLIERIDSAEKAVGEVVETWIPPHGQLHQDPMQWIAEGAVRAWHRTGSRVPLGRYATSPLVAFVSMALVAIGLTQKSGKPFADETVSDHLNDRPGGGRSRRRRSGAKRSMYEP